MPSPELTDFDRRFENVVAQLRAGAPESPESLRDRVRELAGAGAEPRRRTLSLPRRARPRRLALVLVPVCLLGLLAAAAVVGVIGTRSGPEQQALRERGKPTTAAAGGAVHGAAQLPARTLAPLAKTTGSKRLDNADGAFTAPNRAVRSPVTLPPDRRRLQHYDVSMRLRVKNQEDLSDATNRAMQLARGLGGFVSAVSYSTGTERGDASMTLRVPVDRIQVAIVRFSALGTILSQQIAIEDLQPALNAQNKSIFTLRKQIADLNQKLADPSISAGQRLELQHQLGIAKAKLDYLVGARGQTIRQGRLATVSLDLTTRKQAHVAPHKSGRIERSVRHGLSFLAKMVAAALFALIVLSPVLALAALLYFARRTLRRREEARLLAQA
jgi:Domain of unknown function (DUF4349)